jgi:hypothetical protein
MSYGTAETEKLRTNVEEQVGQLPDSRVTCKVIPDADRVLAGILIMGSPTSPHLCAVGEATAATTGLRGDEGGSG